MLWLLWLLWLRYPKEYKPDPWSSNRNINWYTKRKRICPSWPIEEERVPWYYDNIKFLKLGIYPDDAKKKERHSITMMAMQYILCGVQLYMRS